MRRDAGCSCSREEKLGWVNGWAETTPLGRVPAELIKLFQADWKALCSDGGPEKQNAEWAGFRADGLFCTALLRYARGGLTGKVRLGRSRDDGARNKERAKRRRRSLQAVLSCHKSWALWIAHIRCKGSSGCVSVRAAWCAVENIWAWLGWGAHLCAARWDDERRRRSIDSRRLDVSGCSKFGDGASTRTAQAFKLWRSGTGVSDNRRKAALYCVGSMARGGL